MSWANRRIARSEIRGITLTGKNRTLSKQMCCRRGRTGDFGCSRVDRDASLIAGYANRELQRIIDYLRTENAILCEAIGKRRIRLNDDQRRRLAEKGKSLSRRLLASVAAPPSVAVGQR